MTTREASDESQPSHCANCGAPLTGEYCAQCGQSRAELKRPIIGLFTDALDGLLTWDGRLLTTFRQLYARPGKLARDFVDGQRRRFTPPVRLYLVVSLVFFAAMAFSGVRIVAVNISLDETGAPNVGEPNVVVTLFQPPRDAAPVALDADAQRQVIEAAQARGLSERMQSVALDAMNSPDELEAKAAAAASQAMILMVVVFALLSALLHPRRRLIEHTVHALYFHAALLLPLAAFIIVGIRLPLPDVMLPIGPQGVALSLVIALLLAAIATIGFVSGIVLFDRGFYDSSWVGAVLRAIPLVLGYVTSAVFAALGLIFLAAL